MCLNNIQLMNYNDIAQLHNKIAQNLWLLKFLYKHLNPSIRDNNGNAYDQILTQPFFGSQIH